VTRFSTEHTHRCLAKRDPDATTSSLIVACDHRRRACGRVARASNSVHGWSRHVQITVTLDDAGRATDTLVLSETPLGMGFGSAASELAHVFKYSNPTGRSANLTYHIKFALDRQVTVRVDVPVHEAHSSSRRLSAGLSARARAIRSIRRSLGIGKPSRCRGRLRISSKIPEDHHRDMCLFQGRVKLREYAGKPGKAAAGHRIEPRRPSNEAQRPAADGVHVRYGARLPARTAVEFYRPFLRPFAADLRSGPADVKPHAAFFKLP
jgi:hypothetical protein